MYNAPGLRSAVEQHVSRSAALAAPATLDTGKVPRVNEKLEILQMLHQNKISVDEASTLLEAISSADMADGDANLRMIPRTPVRLESNESPAIPRDALHPDMGRFRRLSYIPFASSLAILALIGSGAYATYLRVEGKITFGFVLLLALSVLALLITALAWWATMVPWLHVRIRSANREGSSATRFAISLPVPLTLTGWGLRIAHRFVDQDVAGHLDAAAALIAAMRQDLGKPGAEPIVVDVNDENEHVQVYIG